MKKLLFSLFALIVILPLVSCGESIEANKAEPIIYPLEINSLLYDIATEAPNTIYITAAEENGLSGSPFYITGTVSQVISKEESDYGSRYFVVENGNGEGYFFDFADMIANISGENDGTAEAQEYFSAGCDDTFPQEGEYITVYGLYSGYSETVNAPVFYWGLSETIQELLLNSDEDAEDFTESTTSPEPDASPSSGQVAITAQPTPTLAPTPTPTPEANTTTVGERSALAKAKNYLSVMAFSHDGLISQLEFEGFSTQEATYGADTCGADWNEQALKKAEDYLKTTAFSYPGLISQLEYEKFTTAQATYGVDHCGADWNEQAAKKAKAYLSIMAFSRQSLINQLEFEGFTHDQAVYGVEANGY